MERRKILLGSGAALATVLAGCSSSETGEEEPENDSEESFGDDGDDTGNGSDADSDNDSDTDSGDGSDGEHDDVPGVENDQIEVADDTVTITSIEKDGDKLDIVARTDTTDIEELKKVFATFAADLDGAIEDVERFIDEISSIEWILEHEGSRVLAVYIDVEWVVSYIEGELSDEEFADKVVSTKE
ncbi:hypothetical protein [Halopiger xanaduensis]|uniref:Lipoprotein n=1 Tax=Halopiger xanaduensis (strain DSM 18323 / JCM 14033 / SH-6) TaxID=797210 RepID=F8D766_HALXS|nr:hypothetical protein [Halopiger xanaduensis]AEH36630.1 hypothetical protein Halxa_2005 [Halopiger xanaduensis SH-6]